MENKKESIKGNSHTNYDFFLLKALGIKLKFLSFMF